MSSTDDTDYVHLFIRKIRSTSSIALVFYFPQLSDILDIYCDIIYDFGIFVFTLKKKQGKY